MKKLPKNIFCFIAFSRLIAVLTMPMNLQKLGLFPCLIDSLIHVGFSTFSKMLQTTNLREIARTVLGSKWEQALLIIGISNCFGLMIVYIPQLKDRVEWILAYLTGSSDLNINLKYAFLTVVFLLMILFLCLKQSYLINMQFANACAMLVMIVSIIAIFIMTQNSNTETTNLSLILTKTPSWYDIPIYFNQNNLSYHFILFSEPLLIMDDTSKMSNKSILTIPILTNFFFYFIFGICGFMSIDPQQFEDMEKKTEFFAFYRKQNVPTLLMQIACLYMGLWGCGYYFSLLKEYSYSFFLFKINIEDQDNLEFKKVFKWLLIILCGAIYWVYSYYLQSYAYIIGNISYFFLSIMLPFKLHYYAKAIRNKVYHPNTNQISTNQQSNQVSSSQSINSSEEEQKFNSSCMLSSKLVGQDENKANENVIQNNVQNQIQDLYIQERENRYKYRSYQAFLCLGYVMTGIGIIYAFYEEIYD